MCPLPLFVASYDQNEPKLQTDKRYRRHARRATCIWHAALKNIPQNSILQKLS